MTVRFFYMFVASLVCVFFVGLVKQVQAQEAEDLTQTVRLYEGVLAFPAPIWINSKEELGDFQLFRNQSKNSFSLEQIPKKQSFENWSNLYGTYGWYLPDYTMKRFVAESINALAIGCQNKPKVTTVSNDTGGLILTYHCDKLADPLVYDGKNVESGFLFISNVKKSFAKVYLAWRGKQEDMNTDRWPLNDVTIKESVSRMRRIRYLEGQ